jgi:hypothetical protein
MSFNKNLRKQLPDLNIVKQYRSKKKKFSFDNSLLNLNQIKKKTGPKLERAETTRAYLEDEEKDDPSPKTKRYLNTAHSRLFNTSKAIKVKKASKKPKNFMVNFLNKIEKKGRSVSDIKPNVNFYKR